MGDNTTLPIREKHEQNHAEVSLPRQRCLSDIQSVTVAATCTVPKGELNLRGLHRHLHYLQEPLLNRRTWMKLQWIMTTVSLPLKGNCKIKVKKSITETVINIALPSFPIPETQVSGSSDHNVNQFLTTFRLKIPPVTIYHHF